MDIKKIIIVLLIFFIVLSCLSIFVGNYFYNYAFNPDAKYNVFDTFNIDVKETYRHLDYQEVTLESHDDLLLKGYYIDNHSDITLLMVHGYRSSHLALLETAHSLDTYNILLIDLRGHGNSEGDYIGMGNHDVQDVLLWIDYLVRHNHDIIYLYGVSMGGATVLNVSAHHLPLQVKGIISDCAFTSVVDVIKEHIELHLVNQCALSLLDFMTYLNANYHLEDAKPIEQVQYSQVPILFIHGALDEFISVNQVYSLYKRARCEKRLLVIHDAKHASAYQYSYFYSSIHSFIEEYTKYNKNMTESDKFY